MPRQFPLFSLSLSLSFSSIVFFLSHSYISPSLFSLLSLSLSLSPSPSSLPCLPFTVAVAVTVAWLHPSSPCPRRLRLCSRAAAAPACCCTPWSLSMSPSTTCASRRRETNSQVRPPAFSLLFFSRFTLLLSSSGPQCVVLSLSLLELSLTFSTVIHWRRPCTPAASLPFLQTLLSFLSSSFSSLSPLFFRPSVSLVLSPLTRSTVMHWRRPCTPAASLPFPLPLLSTALRFSSPFFSSRSLAALPLLCFSRPLLSKLLYYKLL